MAEPWYLFDNVNEIDSPALLIYKDRVMHNIALALKTIGDPSKLRPHIKTHKSPEVTKLMMQAGITKFKCATIAEAEMLAQCDAPDIFLAYQPTGPKIFRLINLVSQYPKSRFSCLVDSIDAANAIAREATKHNTYVNVFLDINVGMNRTGALTKDILPLYTRCLQLTSINVVGLHGYDGHINDGELSIRKQKADDAYEEVKKAQKILELEGFNNPVTVMGGSPTFSIHAQRKNVECSPGTFVYWDRSYEELFPDLEFLPAVLVLSRVISVMSKTKICLDIGHKSIASENQLNRRVHFLNAGKLNPVGHSEEHMVVETDTEHKVGDVLYGMPYHVCPTCALYGSAYVVEDGCLKEEWHMMARDRKLFV